jgi:type III pantothenate kinase
MIAPMLLAVDVGNTQTHFGTFRDGELGEHWRFATVRTSTADELGAALSNLLELRGLAFGDLDASIISTVVPELEPEYEAMVERYLRHKALLVGPGLKTGMPIRIDNPRELGADRLVNSIAAYERFHSACVVVDFGTSINYDVVSADGEFLGGIIAPGVEISLDALHQRAAKLVRVDLDEPRGVIGKSTIDSVRSGVVYGFAGQVDGIVERVRAELGDETKAIATGGLAEWIVPYCESIDEVDDLLTLTGLRLIYERNVED